MQVVNSISNKSSACLYVAANVKSITARAQLYLCTKYSCNEILKDNCLRVIIKRSKRRRESITKHHVVYLVRSI